MLKKRISFIVPVFNTPVHVLKACLDSILEVRNYSYEVLVIDDGSSEQMRRAYQIMLAEMDNNLIDYVRQENAGVSEARNTGLKNATGEYVMFVDSDDLLISTALTDLPLTSDMIIFDYFFMKGQKRYDKKMLTCPYGKLDETSIINCAINGQPGFSWAILYRLSFLRSNGFMFGKEYIQCEDEVFNFLILTRMPSIVYFDRKVYQYNYCTKSSINRWRKNPEAMIYSGSSRFQQKVAYVKKVLPENNDVILRKLSMNRIHAIYDNAIDLCCAGQATSANRIMVEEMMRNIELPIDPDPKTRSYYNRLRKKKWGVISIIAMIRCLYLWIRQI